MTTQTETKTAVTSSQEVEQTPRPEYLKYWDEVAADPTKFGFKPDQADVMRGMAAINSKQLNLLDDLLAGSVEDLGSVPVDSLTQEDAMGLSALTYRWFQALGSHNEMRGASPRLVRVADLLLGITAKTGGEHSGEAMRSAAQLYYEAAFLVDGRDIKQFRQYADNAKNILKIEMSKLNADPKKLGTADMIFRLRSELYINDLNQELVRRQMRDFIERNEASGQVYSPDSLLERARAQQLATIETVQDLIDANNSHPEGSRPLNNGYFFEALVELGLRNDTLAPGIPSGPDVFMSNGVRFSTSREDKPYDMSVIWGVPNMGVDTVIDKYDHESGEHTGRSFVQAKSKAMQAPPANTAPKTEFIIGAQRQIDYRAWIDSLKTELKDGSEDPSRDWVFA